MTDRDGVLAVRGLHHRYPGNAEPTLRGIDLVVGEGERLALLGPNGSGKTTLTLHLNGLIPTQQGEIVVDGLTLEGPNLAEIRRRLGLVFQDPNDQLFLSTVAQDVAFGPANLGLDPTTRAQRVTDALAAVGAEHLGDRSAHHLSGGEKRRASLATVLSMDPRVLVLDEPTAGLDPRGQHELADLLVGLPQAQLIVTHDLPFALACCPRSVVLDDGVVVFDGPTNALLDDDRTLAAHRLALPFGYRSAASPATRPST